MHSIIFLPFFFFFFSKNALLEFRLWHDTLQYSYFISLQYQLMMLYIITYIYLRRILGHKIVGKVKILRFPVSRLKHEFQGRDVMMVIIVITFHSL